MEIRSYNALSLAVLIALIGCSGSGRAGTPVLPDENPSPFFQTDNSVSSRHLWGLWDVTIDVQTQEVGIVPSRTAMTNLNMLRFIEPDGVCTHLWISIYDIDIKDEFLEIDTVIAFESPFEGYPRFCGFDVRGIILSNATSTDLIDPALRYSSDRTAGCVVPNADGHTRWWNYPEFHGGTMQVFQYTPGVIGSDFEPDAILNPYKYFCDGLEKYDDLAECMTSDEFIENRGAFTAGSANYRQYILQFPRIDDRYVMKFQYAVDAGWAMPDTSLFGDPDKLDIPEDFPLIANQPEPVNIAVENLYDLVWRFQEWPIELEIEVFSWQALDPDTELIEIEKLVLSGYDGSDWPVQYELSGSALDNARVAGSGCAVSSVWQVEIEDPIPGVLGFIPYLITAEPSGDYSYDQGYDQPAPSDPLAAYRVDNIEVTSYVPSTGGPEVFCSAYPLDAYPDYEITFDASASRNTDALYWDWENDGEYDYMSRFRYGGSVVTHSYPEEGTYQVMVKGVDVYLNEGRLDTPIEITVSEDCIRPVAVVEPDWDSNYEFKILVGYSVEFSTVNTRGTGPVRWYWNWGDGHGYSEVTDSPWIEHEFNETGIFEVKCIACNDCASDLFDEPITVEVVEDW